VHAHLPTFIFLDRGARDMRRDGIGTGWHRAPMRIRPRVLADAWAPQPSCRPPPVFATQGECWALIDEIDILERESESAHSFVPDPEVDNQVARTGKPAVNMFHYWFYQPT
jgi:hypothetical protein